MMQRNAARATLALCLFASTSLWAQNGGPPPAGGFKLPKVVDSPQERAAKQTLISFGALVDRGRIDEAFSRFVSPRFVDHSNMARAMLRTRTVGYAAAKGFFTKMFGAGGVDARAPGKFVDKLTADDEMVTVKGKVGQDLYRVVNGKIVEHWDTLGGFEK